MFWQQLRHVSAGHIVARDCADLCDILAAGGAVGGVRVADEEGLCRFLLGSQFIGFTAVALFGRLADLTRPYLVARRIGLPLSSQVAVYTIERMFDLGAAAIIFSSALAFTPRDLPHHELFVKAGVVSMGATLAIAVFAVMVRVAGGAVAGFARVTLGRLSKPRGGEYCDEDCGVSRWVECAVVVRDFGVVALLSLAMWGMIGGAYLQTAHAFVHTPELAGLTYSRTMLLMAASIGGRCCSCRSLGGLRRLR